MVTEVCMKLDEDKSVKVSGCSSVEDFSPRSELKEDIG